jgi:hypothetical protein
MEDTTVGSVQIEDKFCVPLAGSRPRGHRSQTQLRENKGLIDPRSHLGRGRAAAIPDL